MSRFFSGALSGLFVLSTSATFAQTTATGTVPARATVGSVVTLSNPTLIDFGSLVAGGTSANVPPSYSATVPHAGSIQVDYGNGGATLNVTIDPGNELSRDGTTPKLTTNLACAVGNSATDPNPSQVGCQGQNFNVTNAPTSKTAFIFIGGQVTAPAGAPAGVYNGTVTVRISLTTQ